MFFGALSINLIVIEKLPWEENELSSRNFKWDQGILLQVDNGSYDLDTTAPFTYTAFPPKEIEFAPLNLKVMGGEELSVI